MRRALRAVLLAIAVLVVVGAAVAWYLLGRATVPSSSDYVLDLQEIRRLAAASPGPRPVRVNHEQVIQASLPRGAVFAGASLRTRHPMSHGAYQVVFPDGFLMIDGAFDAAQARKMGVDDAGYDAAAWTAVQRGLGGARTIVLTHEHADHLGGVARVQDPDRLVGRLLMTREQLANTRALDDVAFPEALRTKLSPLEYDRYHAVAPGVVLVKAPGHTPGTQMVYVGLADGREILFLGDVAWDLDQIVELWYRPRLVTDFYLHEDRRAVMAQFRTLHDLLGRERLQLVVSHDVDLRRALLAAGVLGAHFEQ